MSLTLENTPAPAATTEAHTTAETPAATVPTATADVAQTTKTSLQNETLVADNSHLHRLIETDAQHRYVLNLPGPAAPVGQALA